MLAAASTVETHQPADPLTGRGPSQGAMAAMLAGWLGLTTAALIMCLPALDLAFDFHKSGPVAMQAEQLAAMAGLLAVALLVGTTFMICWASSQQLGRQVCEARSRRHRQDIARHAEAVQAANETQARFLSQVAHELRTPMNAVVGFAQLLELQPPAALADAPRKWVEGMAQAAWHMQALLEDLHDSNGSESGRLRLHVQPLEIEPVICEAQRMVQLQADKAGIRLTRIKQPGQLRHFAMADPLRLRQVLLNLLTNAIKYGRRGGHVRIEVESSRDGIKLQVIDNGIGMDRPQVAHLFEPFNRLGRETSGIGGSGIGLSLVRHWVLQMQGEIRVESQVGIGTTVHVRLPAAIAAPETHA